MNATATALTAVQRRENLISAAHDRRARLVRDGVVGRPLPAKGPRSNRHQPRVLLAVQAWLAAGQL